MTPAMARAATSTFKVFPEIREKLHVGLDKYGIQQTLMGAARGALKGSADALSENPDGGSSDGRRGVSHNGRSWS